MITEEHFIRLFVKHEAELNAFALTLMLQPAEADDLLHSMIDAGYYSPVQRISDIL